jgi:hypothetical protein
VGVGFHTDADCGRSPGEGLSPMWKSATSFQFQCAQGPPIRRSISLRILVSGTVFSM